MRSSAFPKHKYHHQRVSGEFGRIISGNQHFDRTSIQYSQIVYSERNASNLVARGYTLVKNQENNGTVSCNRKEYSNVPGTAIGHGCWPIGKAGIGLVTGLWIIAAGHSYNTN